MKRPGLLIGALLGGITALPVVALFYFGQKLAGLSFFPFSLFDWLTRVLPGDLVTVGIGAVVMLIDLLNLGATDRTAKLIEQGMAIGLTGLLGSLLGAAVAWDVRREGRRAAASGVKLGLLASLPAAYVVTTDLSAVFQASVLWTVALISGWGVILGYLLSRNRLTHPTTAGGPNLSRRSLLWKTVAGSLGIFFAAWGAGRYLGAQNESTGAGQTLVDLPPPLLTPESVDHAALDARLPPVPGTRPELTTNDDFYRIDINLRPPVLAEEQWRLSVDGLFDQPRIFTLEALMAFPVVTQAITLSCISNEVGGDLIGTSFWTGLRLRDLLDELGLQPEAKMLYIEAADGFFETVQMADMMDPRTLLVYGMNGETLPVEHGFPLRIYIPDRYGMKQPKWITRIAAIDEERAGFWVERGWSREARPQIISVIDTIAAEEMKGGIVPVGGIAWAGDRGIERVEVQVDGGVWEEAALRLPQLGPLTWVQWRYEWAASPGPHTLRVRAMDGNGDLQVERVRGTLPDGATGYHERTIQIEGNGS